jgi:hypothetical protein
MVTSGTLNATGIGCGPKLVRLAISMMHVPSEVPPTLDGAISAVVTLPLTSTWKRMLS